MKNRRILAGVFVLGLVIVLGLSWPSKPAGPQPLASALLNDGITTMRLMEVKEGPIDYPGDTPAPMSWPVQMFRNLTGEFAYACPPFTPPLPSQFRGWELTSASFRFDFVNRRGRPTSGLGQVALQGIGFVQPDGTRVSQAGLHPIHFAHLLAFRTSIVPRRDPELTLMVGCPPPGKPLRFTIPNPFHTPVQQEWTPEPLPAERTVLGETIRLTRLISPLGGPGHPNFEFPQNTQLNRKNWSVWVQDVTGNFSDWPIDGPPGLSTNEPAWKLIVTFQEKEQGLLDDDVVWNSPEFAAPGIGEYFALTPPASQTVDLQGVTAEVISLFGGGALELTGQTFRPAAPELQPTILDPAMPFGASSDHEKTTYKLNQPVAIVRLPRMPFPELILPVLIADGKRLSGGVNRMTSNGTEFDFARFPHLPEGTKTVQFQLVRRRLPTAEFLIAPPQELKNQTN